MPDAAELGDGRIDLTGRVAVITGGSRGIGFGVAKALLASGAAVTLVARRQDGLDEAAEALGGPALADRVHGFTAHAADPEQARRCIDATVERFGSVDILVNNAATNPYFGPLMGLDEPRAAKTVALNQIAPVLWTQLAWTVWMRDHGGAVVNISSIGADRVEEGIAFYNATKVALEHLTRSLATELGPAVRVNAVAPGIVRTDLSRSIWADDEPAVAERIPLRRIGEPGDVGMAVRFLVSDEASWITGATLVVDGGSMVVPRPLR